MWHGHSGYCAPEKAACRDRCHAHLTFFYCFNWSPSSLIAVNYESHSAVQHGRSGYYAPEKAAKRESCRAHITLFWSGNSSYQI